MRLDTREVALAERLESFRDQIRELVPCQVLALSRLQKVFAIEGAPQSSKFSSGRGEQFEILLRGSMETLPNLLIPGSDHELHPKAPRVVHENEKEDPTTLRPAGGPLWEDIECLWNKMNVGLRGLIQLQIRVALDYCRENLGDLSLLIRTVLKKQFERALVASIDLLTDLLNQWLVRNAS